MFYINNYKILRPIYFSGKSDIYEAIDEKFQKKIALKIYRNNFLTEAIVDNLRNEGLDRDYLSINHENINKCNDLLIVEEGLVSTSDYFVGSNLTEEIKEKGKLSGNDFTRLMNQIIDAFNHAHQKGIIHGNLNPSDIFIQEDGNIKIFGFEEKVLFGLNHFTSIQGARAFVTPEEILKGCNFIDQQSDIYIVGLILFYALTGLRPNFYCGYSFDSSNFEFNPFPAYQFTESEKNIQAIIEKACQLNKTDRYQSFEIWKNEIDAIGASNIA